jgi:hypothetical protein
VAAPDVVERIECYEVASFSRQATTTADLWAAAIAEWPGFATFAERIRRRLRRAGISAWPAW